MAERAGFEPALGYEPKHAFQACDLNRSSTSPWPDKRSLKLYQAGLPQGDQLEAFDHSLRGASTYDADHRAAKLLGGDHRAGKEELEQRPERREHGQQKGPRRFRSFAVH